MEAGSRICRENPAAESDGRIEGGSRQRNETEEQTEESGLGSEELLDVKRREEGSMKDVRKTAEQIVQALGGSENIVHLTNCMTRLRFTLKNEAMADEDKIRGIDGVRGLAVGGGVYQVVIGTDVDVVCREIQEHFLSGVSEPSEEKSEPASRTAGEEQKKGMISRALDVVSATLSPLIPVIMGAAFISILATILQMTGLLSVESTTYQLLTKMSDAVYYFFPVLVAWSFSDRLKCNKAIAIAAAGFLLLPDFMALFGEEGEALVTLFGLPVKYVSYSKQIIPIFLAVLCQKYIEKAVYRVVPKVVRTMVGSGLVMLLTIAVTILVCGPLGALATEGINACIYFVVDKCGWGAVPIIAFINPVLLGTGLGSANFPLMLMSYLENGYEALILPAALAGNAAQAGVGLAIACKTKNSHLKEVSSECAVTALMGITEPIIFSVHYRLRSTLFLAMIAGGLSAILPGVMGVKSYVLATGVFSLPGYLQGGAFNFVMAVLSIVLGIAVGFVITWFAGFKDPEEF